MKEPIAGTDWIRIITIEDLVFYQNSSTKQSVWEEPEEVKEAKQREEEEEMARVKAEMEREELERQQLKRKAEDEAAGEEATKQLQEEKKQKRKKPKVVHDLQDLDDDARQKAVEQLEMQSALDETQENGDVPLQQSSSDLKANDLTSDEGKALFRVGFLSLLPLPGGPLNPHDE